MANNTLGWQQKWPAPAKLNLMLRITGQRPDGYHLLQTVFQFIDLCDWITFHPVADNQVSLKTIIPGVAEADDLTIRAAKLLKAETGCRQGVGEHLQQIDVPEQWVVVIKPDCHVDTKEIFSTKELTRDSKSIRIADFIAGLHNNDCAAVVRSRYQLVEKAMDALSEYSEARLTGTGACVFAQFNTEDSAISAFQALSKNWQVYIAKGMNESPLFIKLNRF